MNNSIMEPAQYIEESLSLRAMDIVTDLGTVREPIIIALMALYESAAYFQTLNTIALEQDTKELAIALRNICMEAVNALELDTREENGEDVSLIKMLENMEEMNA